jgi:5'-3' exonuclease
MSIVSDFTAKPAMFFIIEDSSSSWRKQVYPMYKSSRSKKRAESKIDYSKFFPVMHEFTRDLLEIFPFRGMHVESAEADDLIGVIALQNKYEVICISSDSDFFQLQRYQNFKQYDPGTRKQLISINPNIDLQLKIILGDNDDIPQIKKRVGKVGAAKILSEGKLEEFLEANPEAKEQYLVNKVLVDLRMIPPNLEQSIEAEFNKNISVPATIQTKKIYDFFIRNRMPSQISSITKFERQFEIFV